MEFALEATDSLVWVVDLDADEEWSVHGPVEELFGTDPAAMDDIETLTATGIHPDDVPAVRREYAAVLSGRTDTFDAEFRTVPDGDVRWLNVTGYVHGTDDGARRLIGLATDVTDRKRRERELERQTDRLDEFASVVSHDLRNPIGVASAGVELAAAECDDEHLADVEDALERMEAIVDDTLTLAREGRDVGEIERVDLSSLVSRCWQGVETGGADLRIEDDLAIRADPDRLQHVFENLFRNSVEHGSTSSRTESDDAVEHGSTSSRTESDDAVEHSPTSSRTESDDAVEHSSTSSRTGSDDAVGRGGEGVTVRVGGLEDGIYVEDTGPGIPEEEREAVFEPGHTTAETGTGFGLTIVRRIVEAHGWDVRATGGEGGGARFEITGVDVLR
jgi:PAS domain S-box-containing protein